MRLPELRRHRRERLAHSGLLTRRVGHAAERTVMPPAANSSRAADRPNTTIDATPRNVATQPAIISTSRNSAGNSGGLRAGRRGEGGGARLTAPPPSRSGRPAYAPLPLCHPHRRGPPEPWKPTRGRGPGRQGDPPRPPKDQA